MTPRRITPLLLAGYAALFAAMVCFGLGLLLNGTWAAGAAVVGLLLVWFAHRVVDAPTRAAKAEARAAAKAAAKAAQPSPFNFATVAANGEVVQEREDTHAHDADDEDDKPTKVVASRAVVAEPAPPPVEAAPPVEETPAAVEQNAESAADEPGRILSLEEVRADMALLRQAMLASRPASPPAQPNAAHAGERAEAPTPPSPRAAASDAAPTPRPLPMVDLFARTEVAGLEVSFDEHAPVDDEAAFPSTELAAVEERRKPEDDFPKTQFDNRPT